MVRTVTPLARLVARLLAVALLIALAVAGLAIAVFSIQSGTAALSLPELAKVVGLPALRDSLGDLLGAVEASGPIALLSALGGFGAVLLGLFLLLGVLAGRTERLFTADESVEGTVAAKGRPLASVAVALAEQTRGVVEAKARARPSRGGGSVSVEAAHRKAEGAEDLTARVESQLAPLRSGFGLRTRTRAVEGGKGRRVE